MNASAAVIQDGKVVTLVYTLKNPTGDLLDSADKNDPFVYLHGGNQIVPGLEKALTGLKQGDKKSVVVSPIEGYGERNSALKMAVNRSQFPKDADLKPGMQFEAFSADGEGVVFMVEKVVEDKVHIDGNHPLAGISLHFDVEVVDIRDATKEEMSHGHAHEGDGHHH